MSESIEMRLVLRDEANPALDAARAKADAVGNSSSKAAQGVGQLEKGLTTLSTSAAGASRSLATVDNSLAAVPNAAQRAWTALNTVDGKVLSVGDQFKALQSKLGPASAAISGVSAALGENAGQAGKAVAAAGQLVAAFGSGGPLGVAIAAATLAVGHLTKAWDDEIAAQDRAIASAYAGTDKAAALRARVDADIKSLRRQVSGPETPESARAAVQTEIDDMQRQREQVVKTRNALKVGTEGYDDARDRLESERKILEGVLERLQLKQGLAGAAAAGVGKPAAAPPPVNPVAGDGDTLADWQQRAFDRAAAEHKAQQKLAADRYADAISAAEKRSEAESAIEQKAAEKTLEARRKAEGEFNAWRIETAERAAREAAAADAAILADFTGLAQSSTSTLLNTTQGYIEAKIAGGEEAKYAEAVATAEALKGIGDQLVGFGVMQSFKAAAYAIESGGLDPRAALLGATGATAIGVGLGMGAGAAAITANIPSSGGGAGSGSEAARSTGASSSSSRSSSQSGAPGTTVINITYGASAGRAAEDAARESFRLSERNRRRGREQ